MAKKKCVEKTSPSEMLTNHEKERAKWGMMVNLLHHNVPRFIAHIKNRGGVQDEEWAWLQCEDESPDYPMHMILRADEYLLYAKEDRFKKGLLVLVKTLAIMSFVSGGIHIFDLHFSSEIEGFVHWDGSSET